MSSISTHPKPAQPTPAIAPTLPILLPPGHLTLLLGHPGVGKSLAAIALAALLSRLGTPRSSVVLSLEDTHATLKTRLTAAGANFDYIRLPDPELSLVPHVQADTLSGLAPGVMPSPLVAWLMLNLPKMPNPGLLILDPLPAFLGRHDCYSQGAIRAVLNPLLIIAEQHNIAILGITHMNKSVKSKNPLHRAIGSLAYTALARTIHLVDYHTRWRVDGHRPTTLAQMPRLVIPLKSNLAPITHATAFDITDQGNIHWHESPITDHPLLSLPEPAADPFPQSELDFACEFLAVTLAKGPIASKTLQKRALAEGISKRTYIRARTELGIHPHHDGVTGQWLATLPTATPIASS